MSETGRRLAQQNSRSKKNPQARVIIFSILANKFRWVGARCTFALKKLVSMVSTHSF
jgi:hypothetical protein